MVVRKKTINYVILEKPNCLTRICVVFKPHSVTVTLVAKTDHTSMRIYYRMTIQNFLLFGGIQ